MQALKQMCRRGKSSQSNFVPSASVPLCLLLLFMPLCLCTFAPQCLGVDKAIGIVDAVQNLPDALKTPNRYALVIGVGTYTDTRIPKLPACTRDAQDLRKLLVDPEVGMFSPEHVTVLVDQEVTRINVVDALDQLSRKAGTEDLVLIFFSGHGAVDEQGRSYWVMNNTRIDRLRATAFSETEITDLLAQIKTQRLVTLIDACYSAATAHLGRSKSLVDLQKIYPRFQGQGRVAITASQGDQLSVVISDRNNPGYGHSAFTWQVLDAMRGRGDSDQDGVVTVSELWDYVKDRTETTARQQGGNQQPQLKGQIGSKFLLTVDSERLIHSSQEAQAYMTRLNSLFLEGKINALTYEEAKRLLGTDDGKLDFMQQKRKQVYADLAKGTLVPQYLQAALDAIETPEQRAARLQREAQERAKRQKQEKISQLLATARANDNKTDGRTALAALEELLKLDPTNQEAQALLVKIQGYFGPTPGQAITNSIGMEMIYVEPGSFQMGSNDGDKDEKPVHTVRISRGYWLGKTEVTNGQYQRFLQAANYDGSKEADSDYLRHHKDWSKYASTDPEYPIVAVSWNNAEAFCRWLTEEERGSGRLPAGYAYRLPTEAEWEYAARGGSRGHDTKYAGSDSIEQVSWHSNSSGSKTHPVGQKQANELGLYDMSGNVWEWCQDWYGSYSSGTQTDPPGPKSGSGRVSRGGSWRGSASFCRVAYRSAARRRARTPTWAFVSPLRPQFSKAFAPFL